MVFYQVFIIIHSSTLTVDILLQGKVGINTETPDEALTVVGNVQVTGQILQPSDVRLKTNITQVLLNQLYMFMLTPRTDEHKANVKKYTTAQVV